jgi:hypothetical protein
MIFAIGGAYFSKHLSDFDRRAFFRDLCRDAMKKCGLTENIHRTNRRNPAEMEPHQFNTVCDS